MWLSGYVYIIPEAWSFFLVERFQNSIGKNVVLVSLNAVLKISTACSVLLWIH